MKTILFSVASLLLLLGCNSNDNDIECAEDFTGALGGSESEFVGKWTLTAITSVEEVDLTDDDESNPSKNIFEQYEDCAKDAEYTFETNRAYSFDQGQNTTGCTDKLTVSGTWKLDGQVLSLTNACFLSNVALQFDSEFSEFSSTLTQNFTETNGNIVQTNVTYVYSKN